MNRYEVPSAHLAYCVENSNSFASVGAKQIVNQAPCLPFPDDVQGLVDERLPFVLAVSEKERSHFQAAFGEPTPQGKGNDSSPRPAAYVVLQIVLAKSVGEPFSQIVDCPDGIVQDVFPAEDQLQSSDTSAGSQKPFGFHTDKSCSVDRSPDWVTLSCVRNLERGTTSVSSVRKIADLLSASQKRDLAGENFRFGSNPTNTGPILTMEEQRVRSVRLSTDMTPLTSTAELAYRRLLGVAQDVADPVVLKPGEVLFLPNKTCAHGRHGFEPHQDPRQRRFLQRVYIRN